MLLKVNRGDDVHCWATIDPDGTECVYSYGYRGRVQPLYTEQFGQVQVYPHIRIKDRIVYIASGDKLKLVLFGSKQAAQRLFSSSREQDVAAESSGDLDGQLERREQEVGLENGFKVWKDATGAFSVKAKFSGVEGGAVVLQKTDSKSLKVRFESPLQGRPAICARTGQGTEAGGGGQGGTNQGRAESGGRAGRAGSGSQGQRGEDRPANARHDPARQIPEG